MIPQLALAVLVLLPTQQASTPTPAAPNPAAPHSCSDESVVHARATVIESGGFRFKVLGHSVIKNGFQTEDVDAGPGVSLVAVKLSVTNIGSEPVAIPAFRLQTPGRELDEEIALSARHALHAIQEKAAELGYDLGSDILGASSIISDMNRFPIGNDKVLVFDMHAWNESKDALDRIAQRVSQRVGKLQGLATFARQFSSEIKSLYEHRQIPRTQTRQIRAEFVVREKPTDLSSQSIVLVLSDGVRIAISGVADRSASSEHLGSAAPPTEKRD